MSFSNELFVHSPSVSDRVVALPSLHLEWLAILLTRDADVSIASIQCGIRWGVGGLVFGAKLLFDSVKGGGQLFSILANGKHLAACGFHQFAHGAIAGEIERSVDSRIADQQNRHDGIGFLRGFNR